MLHKTALDRYQKLKKEYARLMTGRFNRDDLDDFIETANSLPEWIRQDPDLTSEQKAALEKFVVPESVDWQICHQVANAQKHVKAKPRRRLPVAAPVVKSVQCEPGGTGFAVPPLMRPYGAGDEIVIEYDEKRESALGFVVRTFNYFRYVFEVVPVPPSQRVMPTITQYFGG
jgi:hypothetical protein